MASTMSKAKLEALGPKTIPALRREFVGYFAGVSKRMTPAARKRPGEIFDETIGTYLTRRRRLNPMASIWNRDTSKGARFRSFIRRSAIAVVAQLKHVKSPITSVEVAAAALHVFKSFKKVCPADKYGEAMPGSGGPAGSVCDPYIDTQV